VRWEKYKHYFVCDMCGVETDIGYIKNKKTICINCYKELTRRRRHGRKKIVTKI